MKIYLVLWVANEYGEHESKEVSHSTASPYHYSAVPTLDLAAVDKHVAQPLLQGAPHLTVLAHELPPGAMLAAVERNACGAAVVQYAILETLEHGLRTKGRGHR